MRHIFIYGFFFQRKSSFGIGYDETGDERAIFRKGISGQHFSGIMERKTGMGLLIDTYGDSEIHCEKINTDIFIFHKTYEKQPDVTIRYNLIKAPEGLYVGTWKARNENGLASLVTADCPFKDFTLLANPLYIIDFLKSRGYKDAEIPFIHDLEQIKNTLHEIVPNNEYNDDLPF